MYGPDVREQFDPEQRFPSETVPFISCYIGDSFGEGVHIGNTHLMKKDGIHAPQYITGINIVRYSKTQPLGILGALIKFVRAMNTPASLTPEERKAKGKDAAKAEEEQRKKAEEAIKNAPKNLEKDLQKAVSDLQLRATADGTINLYIIGDMSLMAWFYNYNISQKQKPSIRLQYGIMGANGKRLRVSPVYEGSILQADVKNFFDVTLTVSFSPQKTVGWNPEDFNKIFADPKRSKDTAKKTTNPKKPYKEGQTVISADEKTRRYSNVVRRIAEGLKWNIGHIEPTTLMPEGVTITVEGFEDGPLAYIRKNFCGTVDQKDGNGKSVKAGAVSEAAHLAGYSAYFDYDQNGNQAFYYVPTQAYARREISTDRIYTYHIRSTDRNGNLATEALDFQPDAINLMAVHFNVEKGDGSGETDLPTVNNARKEVAKQSYAPESKIGASGAARANTVTKGNSQNPTMRNMFAGDTKYALETFEVNQDMILADTCASQLEASLTILYDESVRLLQKIYVAVIMPMNDSYSIGGERITKKVLHPSSGLYQIIGISDEIGTQAKTHLALTRITRVTQQELNQISRILEGNAKAVQQERADREKKARKEENGKPVEQ